MLDGLWRSVSAAGTYLSFYTYMSMCFMLYTYMSMCFMYLRRYLVLFISVDACVCLTRQ